MPLPHLGKTTLFFLLPLGVLALTGAAGLSQYSLYAALLCFLLQIALAFNKNPKLSVGKVALTTLLILLVVGSTGWFLSPFFFLLYLLPIYLGFLYTPTVAFGFLAALLIIFSSSIGEVDVSFDILTLLSLLLVIPLLIYLRKKYLILRQTSKDILILHQDSGIKDADTITELLSNKITKLGVTVRQPLSFIKQAATVLLEEDLNPKEATTYLERIRTTATEALDQVRYFEGDTSKNEVLTNPSNQQPKENKAKTLKKPT